VLLISTFPFGPFALCLLLYSTRKAVAAEQQLGNVMPSVGLPPLLLLFVPFGLAAWWTHELPWRVAVLFELGVSAALVYLPLLEKIGKRRSG
jgi:hypothetical protein